MYERQRMTMLCYVGLYKVKMVTLMLICMKRSHCVSCELVVSYMYVYRSVCQTHALKQREVT